MERPAVIVLGIVEYGARGRRNVLKNGRARFGDQEIGESREMNDLRSSVRLALGH